jgi:integrase/recombinase XerD
MTEQKAYLTPADVDALIEAAPTKRDRAIIRTLFYTAVRETELISIQVADIDFKNKWITIQHLKERSRIKCAGCGARLGRKVLFCGNCGKTIAGATIEKLQEHRKRRVRVDAETLEMIQEYVTKRRDKKNPRLFPLSRQRIQQIVYEAAEDAGLGGKILQIEGLGQNHRVSPHRLRDAFAVHFLKGRDDLVGQRALQQHLGHVNFDTTAKYRKISGKEVAEVYDEVMGE